LLATLIAAPAVIVCCGGGGVALAAITAVGSWFIGAGGIAALLVAAVAALTWRSVRRARSTCRLPEGQTNRKASK